MDTEYNDDAFYSDDGDHDVKADIPQIVDIPASDNNSIDTARTSEATDTHRSDFSDEDSAEEEDEKDGPLATSRSMKRKKRKSKSKNGHSGVDMTPPDKLLKKTERRAQRYTKSKKADKAITELIKCTALARIVYGDGDWRYARSYVNLAEGYLELKNYAVQAQHHAENAKSMMMGGVQMSSSSTDRGNIMEVLINIYYILGRSLVGLKKFSEAEQVLTKAEKISEERAKIDNVTDESLDSWDIKIYLAEARLNAKQQKQANALFYFEKALELLKTKCGKDSVELIPVYQSMGRVEQSKGGDNANEAGIEHFLQAHSIASKHYKGGNTVETADTARALATAYSNCASDEAEISAESYLNECLVTYQVAYGDSHSKTIDVEDELARLMLRMDRPEEALTLMKKGLEVKKEVYGDFSKEVAESWKLIGSVHLSRQDHEKAIRAMKKCHQTESLVYGKNNKKTKDTERTLDLLLANPNLSSKFKKNKEEELKKRPKFNGVVSRSSTIGGL